MPKPAKAMPPGARLADRLPNPCRIIALVGAAKGYAEHLKTEKLRPTDPIPLNPFLHALEYNIIDRELIEDRCR